MSPEKHFKLLKTDNQARVGELNTPHGKIATPVFLPVGSQATVKTLTPQEIKDTGFDMVLANTYHLYLRPGIDVIAETGGLHRFMAWDGAILTDSGGYQVFSLADLREVDDHGVTFRNHLDGDLLRFTPEDVVKMQGRLGVDIAMVLDECPPWPVSEEQAADAWKRTLGWARRSAETQNQSGAQQGPRPAALFGIAQGSVYPRLRERAATELAALPFDGFAIGGVSVGEPPEQRRAVVEWTAPALPEDRPRYLMGVGLPEDLHHAVRRGVDLFDCVLPARNARHGNLFTREGVLRIKNARFRDDPRPPDAECRCPLCRRGSRALIHHLIRSGEITGKVLATLHNLTHYLDLMADLRQAIELGTLQDPAAGKATGDPPVRLADPGSGSFASGSLPETPETQNQSPEQRSEHGSSGGMER